MYKGTWGVEIVDVLKPQPQDIIVEGKRGLCGFASPCFSMQNIP